jgi:hypothetical protein
VDLLSGKLQPHHHQHNHHLADLLKRELEAGQDRQKQLAIANTGVTERLGQLLVHLQQGQQQQNGGGGGGSSSCVRLDPTLRIRANKLMDQLKNEVN